MYVAVLVAVLGFSVTLVTLPELASLLRAAATAAGSAATAVAGAARAALLALVAAVTDGEGLVLGGPVAPAVDVGAAGAAV